ncbi:AGE family epimerase/isomerase [Clostridium cellulovorans]|uniref:Cellobiose 2-epimerase n=1 Tax=Clostridium cellulovorans (strain ATCC 35296 / DSM 3052 / OCM 3 / 743B) TaxID=573061 RepID=D9SUC9_CLOC7|nr:AGE family epimerase/isomerase [Clostridium cellulovorans]ADL52884.1 N-acylglucosamine 2-epimerase [Clostridium cellulovorans 743B]
MSEKTIINGMVEEIKKELLEDILPFWLNNTKDDENGGFYGFITNSLEINKNSEKGVILCTRILWTYSYAYGMFKKEEYKEMATYAYDYLINNFWDKEFGGFFWSLNADATVLDGKKQIYAEAFGIYSLTEYYKATGNQEALEYAKKIFFLIEEHGYDKENQGYFEAYSNAWVLLEDLRLSEKDMNEKKSMNTHLHVLEAYTNLYRVFKDEILKDKLTELIDVTIKHIINNETYQFKLFFDEKWTQKSNVISYGHDIEGSWLLYEAAEVLGDEAVINRCKEVTLRMAEITLEQGIDEDNGLIYEVHENGALDREKHWWPQAEAVVGFYNAYELTGDVKYLEASKKIWDFINKHVVDHDNGEWFWKAPSSCVNYNDEPKVSMWKCPYHNSRMCYEIIQRVGRVRE